MIRPIHPGLSPNVQLKDAFFALKRIVNINSYINGPETAQLEGWFEKTYKGKAFAFTSGRGALAITLKSFDIKKDDEVLVTGFTCVAVVDAVLSVGAKPVYVDITKDYLLDSNDAEKKVTKRTKAIIVQHTFGICNATKEILHLAQKHHLFMIEDMAHGIGLTERGKLLGTFGDATVFSLGRDKAFSSVSGGVAVVTNISAAQKIATSYKNQHSASSYWVFQQLFHTISFYFLILPFYDVFSLGKIALVLFQKIGLLTKPIDAKELEHFSLYTQKLPAALSAVAYYQLQRLKQFNDIRKAHGVFYQQQLHSLYPDMPKKSLSLLRFPLLVERPVVLKKYARARGIYLGDWYSNLIDPKGTDIASYNFTSTSCPQAVYIADHIINLPTYPTLSPKDAEKVVACLQSYAHNTRNNK